MLAACLLTDEPVTLFVEKETELLPEETDAKPLVEKLSDLIDRMGEQSEELVECMANAQSTHICKLFLTENRDMSQSYVYSEGAAAAVAMRAKKPIRRLRRRFEG